MKVSVFLFYLWLFKAGFWGIIIYRRYRRLPKPILAVLSKIGLNLENKYISLKAKGCKYPVWARYQSSDLDVFYQIFIEEEYFALNNLPSCKLFIDCGANVGYLSGYQYKLSKSGELTICQELSPKGTLVS